MNILQGSVIGLAALVASEALSQNTEVDSIEVAQLAFNYRAPSSRENSKVSEWKRFGRELIMVNSTYYQGIPTSIQILDHSNLGGIPINPKQCPDPETTNRFLECGINSYSPTKIRFYEHEKTPDHLVGCFELNLGNEKQQDTYSRIPCKNLELIK